MQLFIEEEDGTNLKSDVGGALWSEMEGRNGRLFVFAVDDGRSMILDRCAIVDKTEFYGSFKCSVPC